MEKDPLLNGQKDKFIYRKFKVIIGRSQLLFAMRELANRCTFPVAVRRRLLPLESKSRRRPNLII